MILEILRIRSRERLIKYELDARVRIAEVQAQRDVYLKDLETSRLSVNGIPVIEKDGQMIYLEEPKTKYIGAIQ